jgi:hypothetical protein
LPPEQRQTERVEMRCTKAQREKLERLGGVQWLRDKIDRAVVKPNIKFSRLERPANTLE